MLTFDATQEKLMSFLSTYYLSSIFKKIKLNKTGLDQNMFSIKYIFFIIQ